ncbi:MAG TPA: hypothetical protein VHO72_04225 [Bacteroidales bacterium]|nr:hypothetical protein [Bacteroidales bacterium]
MKRAVQQTNKRYGSGKMSIITAFLRSSLLLISLFVMGSFSSSNNGNIDTESAWIKDIVSNLDVADYYLTTDKQGNLVITGYFISSAHFGTQELAAMGNYDIFVAKYSPDGTLLWLKQIGSDKLDVSRIIKVDANDNIYVTGCISGIALFDEYIVSPKGSYDVFTVKYSPEGEMVWVKCEGAEIKANAKKKERVKTSFKYTKK